MDSNKLEHWKLTQREYLRLCASGKIPVMVPNSMGLRLWPQPKHNTWLAYAVDQHYQIVKEAVKAGKCKVSFAVRSYPMIGFLMGGKKAVTTITTAPRAAVSVEKKFVAKRKPLTARTGRRNV